MKLFILALLALNFFALAHCNAIRIDSLQPKEERSLGSLFGSLFGSGSTEEYKELPDVDWSKVKFKTIKLETKEVEFTQKKLFDAVEECVKRCESKLKENKQQFQWSWRDKCIQSECDIY